MIKFKKRAYTYLLPNLVEIQRLSFCWFLERGFMEELDRVTSFCSSKDGDTLNLFSKRYKLKQPHCSFSEAKRNEITYSVRIYTQFELNYERSLASLLPAYSFDEQINIFKDIVRTDALAKRHVDLKKNITWGNFTL